MNSIAFFDLEVNESDAKIIDAGAVTGDGRKFHAPSANKLYSFLQSYPFIAGHNIVAHDLRVLRKIIPQQIPSDAIIDTLLLSPLFFPNRPYHSLLKDDKLDTSHANNPLIDSAKSMQLLQDIIAAYSKLPSDIQTIYASLLNGVEGYHGFFAKMNANRTSDYLAITNLIMKIGIDRICSNSSIHDFIVSQPIALAYSLSVLMSTPDSIAPKWVLKNFPQVQSIVRALASTPCLKGCAYCVKAFDPRKALKKYFHYDDFRKYEGEALQENAVRAALHHQSLLAIFPTGGGKSITFQLPALMAGDCAKELTLVISPLQSLMKDQVDNLDKKGIQRAVALNGLLDPLERQNAIERVLDGGTSILYISPESLRSVTIERLLLSRKIARVVIDEAHCFSSWGQDFRVDYLYIGPFLKKLQEYKQLTSQIPISCFTATAKQKVIEDICSYFEKELGLTLQVFRSTARRTNLSYKVFDHEEEEDKYARLRSIVEEHSTPTIIYVSRTKKAEEIAGRLTADGFATNYFHGKMESKDKMRSQEEFMQGEVSIMVATSAFGMGVDKDNVGLVVHYEISDSLENYVQEAGRAGRDENMQAKCFVLFKEADLDSHFNLLQQSKITKQEINQIWKAIKDMTTARLTMSNSALDIARRAGWDENIRQLETRVTTAISALEMAGYLVRGQNSPKIYATSIRDKNADAAIEKINLTEKISAGDKQTATRILRKLFSARSKRGSFDDEAEARVDYIAEQLGLNIGKVIEIVNALREIGVLTDEKDLTAYVRKTESQNKLATLLEKYSKIENSLLGILEDERRVYNLKEIAEHIETNEGIEAGPSLRSVIHFLGVQKHIEFNYEDGSRHYIKIAPREELSLLKTKAELRHLVAGILSKYLHGLSRKKVEESSADEILVEFSILELKEEVVKQLGMYQKAIEIKDIENALFYLSRIDALKIEGGFMVTYNRLSIERKEVNRMIQFKDADYESLKTYYAQKMAQIHIVGEYAKLMTSNYEKALKFVDDYFTLNYSSFLNKYFDKKRQKDISQPINPKTFKKLFGELSTAQLNIINDSNSHIVVAAGPGSGKTRMLVHKLASLLLVEEIKSEQLLMLTFSRAAATEFKLRLLQLIGKGAGWVEIKTFHSFCFDLLDKVGSLEGSENIVASATEKIKNGEIDANKITKSVLVIDEAQDMNETEYSLIEALMDVNEGIRTILVGDDDQNIFEFRGSSSAHMRDHILRWNATKHELIENYRSKNEIVGFSNRWVSQLSGRLKTFESQSKVAGKGFLQITKFSSEKVVLPAIQMILEAELRGSTVVLTQTNEQADIIVGMLKHKGRKAKLIQTNDGFRLSRMLELVAFTEMVSSDPTDTTIQEELWNESRRRLKIAFATSSNIELVLAMIDRFASVNTSRKYKSDWERFLFESKLEDFISVSSEIILVSTIHKSKGREFDNVFLILDRDPKTDEEIRAIYVGMTRAKSFLRIGYKGNYFEAIASELGTHVVDKRNFDDPPKISLTLGLSHVHLGRFSGFQNEIGNLLPGEELRFRSGGLISKNGVQVLQFSNKFRDKLARYEARQFIVHTARITYIVYWWDESKGRDVKVVIPEVVMVKTK